LNGANVSESLASWTMVKRVGHWDDIVVIVDVW
jgi:hypothetical protein